MLDLHANVITPGAVLVLGVGPGVIAAGDGQSVAGVPIAPDATLVGFGMNSATADSIARISLTSQDMVDPISGIDVAPGATSTVLNFWHWLALQYKTGQRVIRAGTNTGVTAGTSLLLDYYGRGGPCIAGSRIMPNQVVPTTSTTFGAALGANAWGVQPYAPATAIPNGKYAILGSRVSACTQAAIRFAHADFQGFKPGYITADLNQAAATSWTTNSKVMADMNMDLQFVRISETLGKPCAPVFSVSNAGTGLSIEMIAAQAATPVVDLFLAKVG
jgi:hypothetical protein